MIGRRIIVRGQVQGVFFRGWTVETARALDLSGWVRNRRTGEVEIVAYGDADSVDRLVAQCRKGPPSASVTQVDVTEADVESVQGFEQRPTT